MPQSSPTPFQCRQRYTHSNSSKHNALPPKIRFFILFVPFALSIFLFFSSFLFLCFRLVPSTPTGCALLWQPIYSIHPSTSILHKSTTVCCFDVLPLTVDSVGKLDFSFRSASPFFRPFKGVRLLTFFFLSFFSSSLPHSPLSSPLPPLLQRSSFNLSLPRFSTLYFPPLIFRCNRSNSTLSH